MAAVTLREHQIEHIDIFEKKIQTSFFLIDRSPTGTGKTITTLHIVKKYGFKLLIIGPANIQPEWARECEKYGVDFVFISYQTLARGSNLYVTKLNDEFVTTQRLNDLILSKCLVVYDESQCVKNHNSKSFKACQAISKVVISSNCGSRIFLLSATLLDQDKFSESVFKLCGIITTKELFHYDLPTNTYITKGYGYEEAVAFCSAYNRQTTDFARPIKPNALQFRKSLYKLLTDIITIYFSHAMPKPKIAAKFIPRLGYFKMEDKYADRLAEAIAKLQRAVRYNPEDKSVAHEKDTMGKVMSIHPEIETSKLPLFVRLIKEQLYRDLNCKVIVYVWYRTSVAYLMETFKLFNPVQANGEVGVKERSEELKIFMQPSNTCRLVIAHPKAAGLGLSLDDQYGEYPRYTFISPNYHFIDIHQSAGRTHRTNTKSDAHFTLVYGKDQIEHSIMEALSRKTEIVKGINKEGDITYPGDYPVYIEE